MIIRRGLPFHATSKPVVLRNLWKEFWNYPGETLGRTCSFYSKKDWFTSDQRLNWFLNLGVCLRMHSGTRQNPFFN